MTTDLVTPPSQVAAAPEPRRMAHGTRHRVQSRAFRIGRWVVIIAFLIAVLVPFYYMLLLSVKPIESLLENPASMIVKPSEFTLQTYVNVLSSPASGGQGFGRFMANSALVAFSSVVLALLIGIPGAYAIARLPFIGRRYISGVFLAAYLFPAILMAIPLFVGFTRIGLRGSLVGLVIVYTAQTVPVAIYMLRNYFETVPVSLEEAAAIDGASRWTIIRRISLPLAMPAVVSNALYVFMIAWNEFLFALLFLAENRPRWTVSLGLSQLAGSIEIPTTVLMAGSVLLTLPIVILFFFAERLLVEGLTSGAEKG